MFGFQRNPVFKEDEEDGEFHCSIIIRPLITASAKTWFITHFMLKINSHFLMLVIKTRVNLTRA